MSMGGAIGLLAVSKQIPIEIHRKLFRVLLISEPWRCRVWPFRRRSLSWLKDSNWSLININLVIKKKKLKLNL